MRSLHDLDAEIRATELRLAQRRQELNRDLQVSRERTRRTLASPAMLVGALVTGFVIERLGRVRRVRKTAPRSSGGGRMAGLAAGLGAAALRMAVSNPQLWRSARTFWEKRMAQRHGGGFPHAAQAPYDAREDVRYPFAGRK